jgi:hypothetical protein
MVKDGLKEGTNLAKCKHIISYPFVSTNENKSFVDFASECASEYGGSLEEWSRTNRKLIGLFGTEKKMLSRNTKFKIPSKIVKEANDRFFETIGLPRGYSSSSSKEVSRDSSPTTSPSSTCSPLEMV